MNNNLIQSKIWYVISCLLFINSLTAKVNPEPGENLWRLTARIGDCVDVADSKLDLLDSQQDLICSKIEKVDDDLAMHNDIVCSKLATIDSVVDGVNTGIDSICSKLEDLDEDLSVHDASICSKLEQIDTKQDLLLSAIDELEFVGACETLIFQSDIPFTIDSPGVYCLAESVSFAVGTAITIASDNVLLDLQDKKIDGSAGGDIGIVINSGLQNITIQNGVLCNMNNKGIDADATNNIAFISMSVLDSLVDMPARIAPIACLQIKDIKVLNVGIFNEFPIVSVVDSIVDSIIDVPDCILSPITGININCATKVILDNCQALCCLGDGFALRMVENGTVKSCNAEENGGNGFVLDNTDTICFKWCKANMNCFHGICDSACNGDNVYLGCFAKQNGIHGFNIAGGGKVLQECIASQNTRDGFNLSTSLLNDADLDMTFGVGGKVTTDFGGMFESDLGAAVGLQKNGKIVVAGTANFSFGLARYNTDGSLDTSFGLGGLVTTLIGTFSLGFATVIQENGKIVVAGSSFVGNFNFAVARYNSDGSLDISFNPTGGLPGTRTTDFGGTDQGLAVALQKDGKIVVAGISDTDFAIARYTTGGILDTTFNPMGILPGTVTTNLGVDAGATAVTIQKDGKIVVTGATIENFVVARYNTDGSLDVTFNPGGSLPGTVTTDFGGDSAAIAVTIQKDGKIVAAGIAGGDFAVARYNTDGSLDATFNPTGSLPGTVTTDFGGSMDQANTISIQKDGKIVVAGQSNTGAGADDNFAVARYNTNGSLDATFNPTGSLPGTIITEFTGGDDRGLAVALQKDGKIVVAGVSNFEQNVSGDFAVARYVVFKRGVAVRDCIAEENGEDGFNIAGSAYDVRDSAAIHNVADGFLLESLTDSCQLLSNEALQNSNIGIENLGINNQIFNNRAHDNAGGNYAGVPLVTTPDLTTSFWANVEA